jgi:hypothetical protein
MATERNNSKRNTSVTLQESLIRHTLHLKMMMRGGLGRLKQIVGLAQHYRYKGTCTTTLATLGRRAWDKPCRDMRKMCFESFRNRGLGWDRRRRAPPVGLGGPTGGFIIIGE